MLNIDKFYHLNLYEFLIFVRWFKICRRTSIGRIVEEGEYIVLDILEKIENEFENYCENEDSEILSNQNIRDKFVNLYFQSRRENQSRKRKRSEIEEGNLDSINEYPHGHKIPIHGIGFDNFTNLSRRIREIRTQNRGSNLNMILKTGVIQFFLLFNRNFQQDMLNFQEVSDIECQTISQTFNDENGFHGPVGRGVAFIFHVKTSDGERKPRHYCLGDKCDYGCDRKYFKV